MLKEGRRRTFSQKKEVLYFDPLMCQTPIIYLLPKIHKDAFFPPGRPIVNGNESVSTCLGQYIDLFLKPLVVETRAYLRDSKHMIQNIETLNCSSNSILVMADVGSLYTIIGH